MQEITENSLRLVQKYFSAQFIFKIKEKFLLLKLEKEYPNKTGF